MHKIGVSGTTPYGLSSCALLKWRGFNCDEVGWHIAHEVFWVQRFI
jgi:hypothetical protein